MVDGTPTLSTTTTTTTTAEARRWTMAPRAAARPLLLVLALLLFVDGGCCHARSNAAKTWCVVKPSCDEAILKANIDFACNHVDCDVLAPGKPCFSPNSYINHASVAMNLYYQANGRNPWNCYFSKSGLVTTTDPSYNNCTYA